MGMQVGARIGVPWESIHPLGVTLVEEEEMQLEPPPAGGESDALATSTNNADTATADSPDTKLATVSLTDLTSAAPPTTHRCQVLWAVAVAMLGARSPLFELR